MDEEIILKKDPDARGLRELYESPDIVPPNKFFPIINPTIYGPKGDDAPDQADQFLNRIGWVTPKIQRLRAAHEEEQRLMPAYNDYLAYKLAKAKAPTLAEAADRFGLSPSVAPQSMMPGPQVTTPGNLEDVIGGTDLAQGIGDIPLRPGLQPKGFPQTGGPFGLPLYAQPRPLSTTPLTPQYEFPTSTPGPQVPNLQAPLRPLDQQIVGARVEALKHPRVAPAVPQGLQEFDRMVQAEMAAAVEENGGKPLSARQISNVYLRIGKVYSPGALPGSPEHEKVTGEAQKAQAEGRYGVPKMNAEIEALGAKAAHDRAETDASIKQLMGRMQETQARIGLLNTQASTVGVKAELAEQTQRLLVARGALAGYVKDIEGLPTELKNELLRTYFSGVTGVATTPKPLGPIDRLLQPYLGGPTEGEGIEKAPEGTFAPRGSRNPSGQPLTPNLPPTVRNQAEESLIELGRMMKENEIITSPITGKRLQKRGNKLTEVKE